MNRFIYIKIRLRQCKKVLFDLVPSWNDQFPKHRLLVVSRTQCNLLKVPETFDTSNKGI